MDTTKLVELDPTSKVIVTNIHVRRMFVTAINEFDKANGIRTSQSAKYEKPMWYYVLACLRGYDGGKITCEQIIEKLATHNIIVTYQQVYRAIKTMQNKDESIKPHRRNCGISCYGAVSKLGDIQRLTVDVPIGAPVYTYCLGCDCHTVNSIRREYNITLAP